jgi:signal transduction histidine kinase
MTVMGSMFETIQPMAPEPSPLISLRQRPRQLARIQEILNEACAVAPLKIELLDMTGEPLITAGRSEWLSDAAQDYAIRDNEQIIAWLRCSGDASIAQIVSVIVSARITDQFLADLELDSLSNEILHTYEMLHVIYDLTENLGRSLDSSSIGTHVIEQIMAPLHAQRARVVIFSDGNEQQIAERRYGIGQDQLVELTTIVQAPLLTAGETSGYIEVSRSGQDMPFSSADLKLLDAVAIIAASALQNASHRRRELALCDRVRSEIAQAPLEVDPLLNQVVESIAKTFEYQSVSCWLIEADQIILKSQVGLIAAQDRLSVAASAAHEVVISGKSRLIAALPPEDASRWLDLPVGVASALFIPLVRSEKVIGLLQVAEIETLSAHDLYLIESIVVQVNIAIENAFLVQEIQRANTELLEASKLAAIGTLAAGVSHEFNNLLTGIQGFAELALRDQFGNKDDALETILRASQRGAQITRGLLTYARPQPVMLQTLPLHQVVEETLRLVEPDLHTRGIQVVRVLEEDVLVSGDMTQLMQVLLNLITNARDAIDTGGGRLTVSLRQDGQWAYLEVEDTGCGIADEYIERIFEPFVTTKGALGGSHVQGTGLGLSVSYGIAKAHHGELRVHSQVGYGSTFVLMLPRLVEPHDAESPDAPEALVTADTGAIQHILLVDDDPDVRRFVARLLTSEGYQVNDVPDAIGALEACRQRQWDVIVTDLQMPGMDGLTMIRRLRDMGNRTPVVLMTGRSDALSADWELPDQSLMLAKPFSVANLISCIAVSAMCKDLPSV